MCNSLHERACFLCRQKRVAWKYAKDRAKIASIFSWLQLQISILDCKIQDLNKIQLMIRKAKNKPNNAKMVNDCRDLPKTNRRANVDLESSSSRTRPFDWSSYRKRELLTLDQLHEVSEKAARPATLRCYCDGLFAPCALCTGRQDPTQPMEFFKDLSIQERIALVDPHYHPQISLREGEHCFIKYIFLPYLFSFLESYKNAISCIW